MQKKSKKKIRQKRRQDRIEDKTISRLVSFQSSRHFDHRKVRNRREEHTCSPGVGGLTQLAFW
eukprot:1248790-Amphidinium_carterae.1